MELELRPQSLSRDLPILQKLSHTRTPKEVSGPSTSAVTPTKDPSSAPEQDSYPVNLASTPSGLQPSLESVQDIPSGNYVDSAPNQNTQPLPHKHHWIKDHPLHQIIGDPNAPVQTRSMSANDCLFSIFLSKTELSTVSEALKDPDWIIAMQEELNQFKTLKVCPDRSYLDVPSICSPQELHGLPNGRENGFLEWHPEGRGVRLPTGRLCGSRQTDSCLPTEQSSLRSQASPKSLLHSDPGGKEVDATIYTGMIGSLMYLTASRPDIMFSTCLCARYQSKPKESHLIAVKRIFRYLKGTTDLGLCYPKDTGYELVAYSDADHAGCMLDRKSTMGHVQFLGNKLVSWASKKQNCVSTSTAEAEYVAALK
ncbi:hypothetical protein L6452_37447 [Arctium lappa]|uniref:Uncharacterized protein n=1 Tax=Arctium lappa TaxID=4217 RepID=A0ACB8Y419_ARCLA|nr:hypothetical protein L6452_37447 [Arctium lappa]